MTKFGAAPRVLTDEERREIVLDARWLVELHSGWDLDNVPQAVRLAYDILCLDATIEAGRKA